MADGIVSIEGDQMVAQKCERKGVNSVEEFMLLDQPRTAGCGYRGQCAVLRRSPLEFNLLGVYLPQQLWKALLVAVSASGDSHPQRDRSDRDDRGSPGLSRGAAGTGRTAQILTHHRSRSSRSYYVSICPTILRNRCHDKGKKPRPETR